MLNQWMGSLTPPPKQLAERLDEAVLSQSAAASGNPSDSLTAAAVGILEGLASLDAEHSARAAALDLLAADALITYAVEAATEDCDSFAEKVDAMIDRLSRVARDTGAT